MMADALVVGAIGTFLFGFVVVLVGGTLLVVLLMLIAEEPIGSVFRGPLLLLFWWWLVFQDNLTPVFALFEDVAVAILEEGATFWTGLLFNCRSFPSEGKRSNRGCPASKFTSGVSFEGESNDCFPVVLAAVTVFWVERGNVRCSLVSDFMHELFSGFWGSGKTTAACFDENGVIVNEDEDEHEDAGDDEGFRFEENPLIGGKRIEGLCSGGFDARFRVEWRRLLDAIDEATALIMAVEGTEDKLVNEAELLRPDATENDKLDLKEGFKGELNWVGMLSSLLDVTEYKLEWCDTTGASCCFEEDDSDDSELLFPRFTRKMDAEFPVADAAIREWGLTKRSLTLPKLMIREDSVLVGSHWKHLSMSLAQEKRRLPSSLYAILYIGPDSFVEEETWANASKSQNLTVPSKLEDVRSNSLGWKAKSVTGDECSLNSARMFPAAKSHIWFHVGYQRRKKIAGETN